MTDPDALGHVHRYQPPAAAAEAPTLLLLHGTGGDETDLLPLGTALHEQAGLLSVRGAVSENGMPRFFHRHAEGVFDIEDLVARTHQLADFVLAAADHYRFDPSRVLAAGFSNGANIATATMLLRPGVLRGAMLFAPMVVFDAPDRVDLGTTGVFISAGRGDPIATSQHAERLADQLTSLGAAVELRWHSGGHTVDSNGVGQARAWLAKLDAATSDTRLP
jgi:phospholipase/carboxylesterase